MHTLELLGGLHLGGPDGAVTERLPQRRPLAVLAVLAVARTLGCSRAKLTGLLWPEEAEPHARHHLSDALSGIRHGLGPRVILADGEMLYVDQRELRSDVAAFEDALGEGRLEDAVAMYRGPLLDGFYVPAAGEFDEWVARNRERLASRYAAALEKLAHAAAAGGHTRSAADWLRCLVSHDPCNTRVVLKLLAALEEAGDRPNALRSAEEHVRRLRGELGVEPDEPLLRAIQRLRAIVPPPLAPAPAYGPRGEPPRPAEPEAPAPRHPRRRNRLFAASGVATALLVTLAGTLQLCRGGRTAPSERWVVVPFTTVGTDSVLTRLAWELPAAVELLLPGPPGPYVRDRAGAVRRWRRAGGTLTEGLPEEEVLDLAHQTGGGRLLLGTLARERDRVDIVLRLLAVPSGSYRGVQAGSAPADSTQPLLSRLLEALRAGDSLDTHAAPPAPAQAASLRHSPRVPQREVAIPSPRRITSVRVVIRGRSAVRTRLVHRVRSPAPERPEAAAARGRQPRYRCR
jgi:DNA-binding SARP family transcriptional activator